MAGTPDPNRLPEPGWRRARAEAAMVFGRGGSRTHQLLRSRLLMLIGATLVLDALGTVLMFLFEHDAGRSDIENVGDALFWVSAQLTTVSSQMSNPVTTGGRVVDLALEVWAISVVATLAASLAAFLRARHEETAAHDREAHGLT